MNASRRFGTILGAAVLAGTALLTPATASATSPAAPVLAHDGEAHCLVESGTLSWGMKESFRRYITGSIANGSWETGEGVEYVAPSLSSTGAVEPGSDLFAWSNASGELESDLTAGTVGFTGSVHFSGHNGSLELNIANPGLEFTDPETAYLLLEVGEAAAGETGTRVRAAKLELDGVISAEGTELSIAGATVRLTSEGAEAFNGGRGSYVAGEEMDPLYFNATVSGCDLGEVVAAAPTTPTENDGAEDVVPISAPVEEAGVPWVPIVIGGVAILVIGVAGGMLLAGRKKGPSAAAESDSGSAPATPTDS